MSALYGRASRLRCAGGFLLKKSHRSCRRRCALLGPCSTPPPPLVSESSASESNGSGASPPRSALFFLGFRVFPPPRPVSLLLLADLTLAPPALLLYVVVAVAVGTGGLRCSLYERRPSHKQAWARRICVIPQRLRGMSTKNGDLRTAPINTHSNRFGLVLATGIWCK